MTQSSTENENLTCGIIDSFSLKQCNPISLIDTPSMLIIPCGSASRNKADINDDLPAPVRPTIPTYLERKVLVLSGGIF